MTTINMNTFQLPCSSTSDFMARMRLVSAAYNSFAEVGGVPKSPRSKVRMRRACVSYSTGTYTRSKKIRDGLVVTVVLC